MAFLLLYITFLGRSVTMAPQDSQIHRYAALDRSGPPWLDYGPHFHICLAYKQ
jgi:hypothetical protein